jgi:hypothetical protein
MLVAEKNTDNTDKNTNLTAKLRMVCDELGLSLPTKTFESSCAIKLKKKKIET